MAMQSDQPPRVADAGEYDVLDRHVARRVDARRDVLCSPTLVSAASRLGSHLLEVAGRLA
jgi:hypothetical protein